MPVRTTVSMPRDLSCCSRSVPAKAPQCRLVTRMSPCWKPAEGAISDAAAGSGFFAQVGRLVDGELHEVFEIDAHVDDGSAMCAKNFGKFFGVFDNLCRSMRHG